MPETLIGILAGMGPRSTAPFLEAVYDQCQLQYGATYDNDYPPILVYSLPTPFYLDRPIDHRALRTAIAAGLRKLEQAGAGYIAMPCNTAHLYLRSVAAGARGPAAEYRQRDHGLSAGGSAPGYRPGDSAHSGSRSLSSGLGRGRAPANLRAGLAEPDYRAHSDDQGQNGPPDHWGGLERPVGNGAVRRSGHGDPGLHRSEPAGGGSSSRNAGVGFGAGFGKSGGEPLPEPERRMTRRREPPARAGLF